LIGRAQIAPLYASLGTIGNYDGVTVPFSIIDFIASPANKVTGDFRYFGYW